MQPQPRPASGPAASPALRVVRPGRVGYADALARQREAAQALRAGTGPETLFLLEHAPVVTMGRRATGDHVLLPPEELARRGVELVETDRGGDVTFHGPGQIVGYPILDLNDHRRDVKWYVQQLEEVLIRTCARHGVHAGRVEGMTGAWVGDEKIGAIGVRVERWITSHGFALNVATDLEYFGLIIPCGLRGRGVTSLAARLGRAPAMESVLRDVEETFKEVFGGRA